MFKKLPLLALFGLLILPAKAADNALIVTPGTGVTVRSVDVGSGVQAPGHVIVNSAGTNIVGAGTTLPVSGTLTAITSITNPVAVTGTFFQATQPVSATSLPLPAGAATSALQTTINTTLGTLATSANQTNASQKTQIVDGSGNVIASTSNNLNVQCANCSGSGASAVDAATFTVGTSVFAPIGGQYTSGGATACVTGHQCLAGITAARELTTHDAALLSAANAPLPGMPLNRTYTGCGATVTGTASTLIASSSTIAGGWFANISSDILWVSFTGTAVVGGGTGANRSFPLPPLGSSGATAGGSFTFPEGSGPGGAVSIISAGTSSAVACVTHT